MRVWILIALLPCAALAQTSPPRPADRDALKKLQQRLDWFQPNAGPAQVQWKAPPSGTPRVTLPPVSITVRAAATETMAPGACSIPLLRAPIPDGDFDRMAIRTAPGESFDPKFILPAPAVCGDRQP